MQPLLEVRNLGKSFAGFAVLKNIDFSLAAAGSYALIGPNGAGKTTLFNIISRVLAASQGDVVFQGKSLRGVPPHELERRGLLRTFQLNSVFAELSVKENIAAALVSRQRATQSFWREVKELKIESEIERILKKFGLSKDATQPARNLSYGTRKVLELAICEVFAPKLLLLDEPLAGVGLHEIENIKQVIRQLANERTVLMIDHNMSAVAELCSKIFVLHQGNIIAAGTFDELMKNPAVQEAYLGTST